MGLASIMFAIVAVAALGVCAQAITTLGRQNAEVISLLSRQMTSATDHLSRAHGSLGMALADVAQKTAGAIGDAVSRAVTPVAAPATPKDAAYQAAREYMATDEYRNVEPDDFDSDPTDWAISPARDDLAVVSAGDRNPTGVPGFAFDLTFPTPINGNGHS